MQVVTANGDPVTVDGMLVGLKQSSTRVTFSIARIVVRSAVRRDPRRCVWARAIRSGAGSTSSHEGRDRDGGCSMGYRRT